jgi:3-isopropylmalate/(R)-2-methylmalate dehydratase small subunit
VPVVVDPQSHARLLAAPGAEVSIDLEKSTITLPGGGAAPFAIDAFARYCLLNGVDELGFLLSQDAAIAAFEGAR